MQGQTTSLSLKNKIVRYLIGTVYCIAVVQEENNSTDLINPNKIFSDIPQVLVYIYIQCSWPNYGYYAGLRISAK